MVITDRKESALGNGNIAKLFLKLAAPAIAAQLINLLYNLVDRLYIGHIRDNGDLALTGLGVCLPLIICITAFASLFSLGSASRASISIEKGDTESAEKTLGNSMTLMIIVSVVLTAVFQLFSKDILLAFGASDYTIGYAADYMLIYSLGTIFVIVSLGLNAFISAQGFSKTSMYIVLIGAASNIILDPIFIFGFDMGVKGAAIATVISQGLSSILTLSFLLGEKTRIKIKSEFFAPESKVLMPCLLLGLVPFILQFSEGVIALCFNKSLYNYGGDIAVGAMTVLFSIMQFSLIPLVGLSQGAQPIISYNYGLKNIKRVRKAFRLLTASCLIYSTALWAAVEIWPENFIKIFNGDAELVKFTVPALRIYFMASGIFGLQIACQQTLISLGKVKRSVSLAIVRKILLLLPLIFILPAISLAQSKTTAIFMAEPVADIISLVYTVILFFIFYKKVLNPIEETDDSHKQSGYYRFLRGVIRFFTKPMKTIWDVPFEGKPSIFVCNHDRAFGPIAMCAHFELSEDVRPWINAQVLSEKEAPAYIRQDYWWDLNKWYSPILGYTVTYIYALILPPILRGSDCIPVYHDTSVISTLRESVKMLSDGKHILLFPEHPTGYCTYGEKIFDGFISVGRLYYARTKETVNFYPTYVNWEKKIIRVGKPIPYDPTIKYDEQVSATSVAIEEYFKKLNDNQLKNR